MGMEQLPSSDDQVGSIIMTALLAGFATLWRLLLREPPVRWRIIVANIGVSMCCAWATFAGIASAMNHDEPMNGYVGLTIGVLVGLFTDEAMRGLRLFLNRFLGRFGSTSGASGTTAKTSGETDPTTKP